MLAGEHVDDRPGAADYRPGVDGLRALAVAAVLAFHLDRLPGGNLGVDAFFVISGWLITWKLLDEAHRSDTIQLRRFWTARIRRLAPASLCVLLAVSVIWPLVGIAVPSLRGDIVWAALWSSNWGTIFGGGDYWARFGEPSPITHFWSLAIEEQFYLVWPVIVAALVATRRRRRAVGVVGATLAILSIGVMIAIADPSNPTAAYMNTFARAHSLLIGAVAAAITVVLPDGSLRGGRAARRLAVVAVPTTIALVAVSSHSSQWLFSWGFPLFALAMAVIVVAAADGCAASVLASPPMRWVSDRSYGLYLWHWPVFLLLTPTRTGLHGIVLDAVRVAIAVAIADQSYRWIETPIRRRRSIGVRWMPIAAAGACALVVVVAAVTLVPARTAEGTAANVTLPPAPAASSAATVATTVAGSSATAAPGSTATATTAPGSTAAPRVASLSPAPAGTTATTSTSTAVATAVAPAAPSPVIAVTGPMRVLVTGDSTAQKLAESLLPYATEHPEQLLAGSAAFPGCGLSASDDGRLHAFTNERGEREKVDLGGCTAQWKSVSGRVAGDEQIDVVLVDIGAWDAVNIHLADGSVVSVADPDGLRLVRAAYRSFVRQVNAAGATVVWITPPDVHLDWGTAADDPINDPARWAALRSIIDDLAVPQIDLRRWLAEQGLSGPEGRPDGVHLAPDVNERFVREVVGPELQRLSAPPA